MTWHNREKDWYNAERRFIFAADTAKSRSRWLKHFILVTGYMTMMTLVIVCIRWFQVDDSSWHFTSIFGYYATAALLVIT